MDEIQKLLGYSECVPQPACDFATAKNVSRETFNYLRFAQPLSSPQMHHQNGDIRWSYARDARRLTNRRRSYLFELFSPFR